MKSFDKDCLFMDDNHLNNIVFLLNTFYKSKVMGYDHYAISDNAVAFFYVISYIFSHEKIKHHVLIERNIIGIEDENDVLPENYKIALDIAYELLSGNIGIQTKEDIPEGFETIILNAIDILLSEYEIANDKKIQLVSLTVEAIKKEITKLIPDEIEDIFELER